MGKIRSLFIVLFLIDKAYSYKKNDKHGLLREVFAWKQIGYDFDGYPYCNSTDTAMNSDNIHFPEAVGDSQKFFNRYNNVPIGFEKYGDRVFVTVPRRRHGIPSTLNYISLDGRTSPLLKPYPDTASSKRMVSIYRPRVDVCGRLWGVDTGLLEVPGERKQFQPPAILVFDLKTDQLILKYELKSSDVVDERTPAGLTSITIDVDPSSCNDAYAYINDLATEGLIVFSMKDRDSWRINHPSFVHNEAALNFNVAGFTINWKDGLFSIALSDRDERGKRTAYYHPLVSTQEFSVGTDVLKNRDCHFDGMPQLVGTRGPATQSGSHDYHSATRTLLYANVAQDAILCWNIDTELRPENVAMIAQDHQKLVYISDLKVIDDDVWVLVNQIPRFVYSTLNPSEYNYFIHRGNIQDLIRDTICDQQKKVM